MAAIFQIRRGSGSVSLTDGELYLHKSSGSLQISLGDANPITLARLDQPNSGSLRLGGDITASNAYFSGDVAISGNLYLGNQSSDNISALGQFTTNLVPTPNNGIDIGTTSAVWRNVYATSFSGSFSGSINGISGSISSFSASVDARLDRLQESTASLNAFTSSQEGKDIIIAAYTASMNSFTSSQAAKDIIIGAYTASMNSFTSSVNGHISDINAYTQSLRNAIDVTGGNTRILGNLIVDGTQTSLNVNEVYIEDKSITLASGSATSAIADGAGLNIAGAGVSMSWDNANTRLYFNTNISALGSISSSTIVGLNNVSVTTYSTSVDSRLSNLQSTSASVNGHIVDINTKTGSFEAKFTTLQSYTASIDTKFTTLQTLTASYSSSIGQINAFTASNGNTSLNTYTASNDTKWSTLQTLTASYSSSIGQINSATASFNTWTGSTYLPFSTSVDSRLDNVEYVVTVLDPGNIGTALLGLNAFTTSAGNRLNNLETTTSSLNSSVSQINTFTASNNISQLNLYTASLKGAITISGTDVSIAGGLTVLGTTTIIDSTTVNIKDNIIQLNGAGSANAGLVVRDATGTTTSGSLLWDTTNDYWIAGPLGAESKLLRAGGDGVISGSGQISAIFEEKASATHILVSGSSQINFTQLSGISSGIVSSSTQIIPLLPTGVISGSSQILGGSGIVSSSAQVTTLLPIGTISGSSQVNFTQLSGISSGIVSSSAQITPLLPTGTLSGSIQVLGGSTIHSGSAGNYQFNSIGVGTAASTTAGEIRATGDITAYYSSDIRLKENIQPIENALEKVNQISGNTYDWKEGYDEIHSHKGNDVGVIAQEIESILPQIVTNRDSGYKAVQYEKIIPLLIEAIKELSAKVNSLEKK
jgi:hypothetical protein